MEPNFWHQRWQANQIGFHEGQANALLAEHFRELALQQGARVFMPLCGKTCDIDWLMSQGYRVAGAELSTLAVEQLFSEHGIEPRITPIETPIGKLTRYHADRIDIFAGDIFELGADVLGPVDAVYDRAALVAFPDAMRKRYTAHLMAITATAPQFLICFEYDQSKANGPPFSITEVEVRRHYGDAYELEKLVAVDLPDGLRGQVAATETAWRLRPR